MSRHFIALDVYLKWAQHLVWFTSPLMGLLLTGKEGRHYRTERALYKLSSQGRLIATQYGHQKVYLAPRMARNRQMFEQAHIAHGLGISHILISFLIAERLSRIVKQASWFGCGIYPDCCLLFPQGWYLPVEFSTPDNASRTHILKTKVTRYLSILEPTWQILFVLDTSEEKLEETVKKLTPHEAFYYITYTGFRKIPLRKHLTSPVYLNGATLRREALR